MPLSATTLANAIRSEMDAAFPLDAARGVSADARQAACDAIARAVVNHIQSSARVDGTCPAGGGPLVRGRVS